MVPTILFPDIHGVINIRKNKFFQFSCVGNRFKSPINHKQEITVKCYKETLIKFNGTMYDFRNFSCESTPKSSLVLTNRTCQRDKRIIDVGFQTEEYFFKLYRICFDMVHLVPIYSWYIRRKPVFRHRQTVKSMTLHSTSNLSLYDNIELNKMYTTKYLVSTVSSNTIVLLLL